jgi:dTDP-4-dehydrorhamnose reductase
LVGLTEAEAVAQIEAVSEDQAQRLAGRPRYTPMRCQLTAESGLPPLRSWQAALAAYVQQG